jgi:hypothetical protein
MVDLPDARPEIANDMGMAALQINQCYKGSLQFRF